MCLSCVVKIVLLNKSSVIKRSIVFDWQNFIVSSIMFYLSSAIERLVFDWVRLPNCSITYPGTNAEPIGKIVCYGLTAKF